MSRIKKNVVRLKQIVNNWIVKVLGLFLPKEAYIQQLPNMLFSDKSKLFRDEYKFYKKELFWSLGDANRVAMFCLLLERVKGLEGEFAELGVHRGGTSRIIFKHLNQGETLYGFDTFEGFDEKDVKFESSIGVKTKSGHFSNTSTQTVTKVITGSIENNKSLELRKGYFPETFVGLEDLKWKFVHLDADLYNPIKAGLELFYPRMVKGGVLLVHDYGGEYIGAKKAVDEFALNNQIQIIPMYDKVGSALIIKN